MNVLGIDYGRKKIGLALGDTNTRFAEPLTVIQINDWEEAIKKISQYVQVVRAEKLILGISEGEIAREIKEFSRVLRAELNLPVLLHDETLTTYEAQRLSITARMKRKKRKEMEDSFSAALILQDYLNSFK